MWCDVSPSSSAHAVMGFTTVKLTQDKNFLIVLLEARIQQLHDLQSTAPTFTGGEEQFLSALQWAGAGEPVRPDSGLTDLRGFSTEVLLWMARSHCAHASLVSSSCVNLVFGIWYDMVQRFTH